MIYLSGGPMRFECLYTEKEVSGRCGDVIVLNERSYQVIGHTNFGKNLLVRSQDSFQVFKVQLKAKS